MRNNQQLTNEAVTVEGTSSFDLVLQAINKAKHRGHDTEDEKNLAVSVLEILKQEKEPV